MGIGNFLGGAAQGLKAGADIRSRENELRIRQQGLTQNATLRERALGLQEQRQAQNQVRGLLGQADKLIAEHFKVVGEVIKASKEAGESPDKIAQAVQPLMEDVDTLASAVGRDPTPLRNRVSALIGVPDAKDEPKVGSTVESIRARIARGDPLSASEKQVYADALRINRYDRMLLGYDKDDESATLPGEAPQSAATPIPTAPASQGAPAPPSGALSTGPMTMPADKSALVKGQVYNLPDGRQGLWNGTGFEIL